MVRVYAIDITMLPDPAMNPEMMEGLDEERREKILRHKFPAGRRQSLGAGLLLKSVLEKYGILPENIVIGPYGKPEVDGICFNLSHSEEMIVCAVSEKNVGCDVERIRKAQMRVADRFFCDRESAYLYQFGTERRNLEFTRLWTMKESYIKMTGEGIRLPLKTFEVFLQKQPICIEREGVEERCHVREYPLPGYCVTVCTEDEEFADKVEWLEI